MTESLTNLEVVKPKGPKIFVGLLVLAAAAGVGWHFFGRTPGPIGEPEDAGRLLLVGTDDPATGMLEQMGFEVEQLPLADAGAAGRSAGSSDQDDVDAALYYADSKGYGYVAFAGASQIDFGSRAVSAESASVGSDHRYAVFSVGDFAQPHPKVTVDPSPRRYSGGLYDEFTGRGWLQDLSDDPVARSAWRDGEWNRYRIEADGPRLRCWVNGVPTADFLDTHFMDGLIGLQVHSGRNTRVRWRGLTVVDRAQERHFVQLSSHPRQLVGDANSG